MDYFAYRENKLYCEEVDIADIAAKVGTPFYLYSAATIRRHYQKLNEAFGAMPHLICYALKANPNLAICRLLAELGCGAEVVSGGELYRALKGGIDPRKIVFDGNAKTAQEIRYALRQDILMINVDSCPELELVAREANALGVQARIGLRVNPDIDPKTHQYISTGLKKNKFGVPIEQAVRCYQRARDLPFIEIVGIHMHIGSQMTDMSPLSAAAERLALLVDHLADEGVTIQYIDVGGGLGIQYNEESAMEYDTYAQAISAPLERLGLTIIAEPGRTIVGNAGVLVTEVLFVKRTDEKNFVVVDAAMNDLMRPMLYNAYHKIDFYQKPGTDRPEFEADVVGGICESSDFLAKDRLLREPKPGELLVVRSAGAYGASMSSQYNSRPLIPEVLVYDGKYQIIRRRPKYEEMVELEEE